MLARISITVILFLFCCGFVFAASISNFTEVQDINTDYIKDASPVISDDELTIYFLKDNQYMKATRSSAADPFGTPSSSDFTNIDDTGSNLGDFWISADQLHLYFTSDRDGSFDIFTSSRSSTTEPFPAPSKVPGLSIDGSDETVPRLTEDRLHMYFNSDRYYPPGQIFYSTRLSTGDNFSPPVPAAISHDYSLFDISDDNLTIFLIDMLNIYYSQRDSILEIFPEPVQIYSNNNYILHPGSLTSDLSRIYLARYWYILFNPAGCDIYAGDVDLTPDPTPDPTPTPVYPAPEPNIFLAASGDDIENLTGNEGCPWGVAFDEQGRLVFFDYKAPLEVALPSGSNSLLRMEEVSGQPVFTTILTLEDLEAYHSEWASEMPPLVWDVGVTSDGDVILSTIGETGGYGYRLLRIIPGNPPQIVTVFSDTSLNLNIPIEVDRSTYPNTIFMGIEGYICSISANAVNGSYQGRASVNEFFHMAMPVINDIEVDINGDVICTAFSTFFRIDRSTWNPDYLAVASGYLTNMESIHCFDINPISGDIAGLFFSDPPYPNTTSAINLFKMTRTTGNQYQQADWVTGSQIMQDPEIAPFNAIDDEPIVFADGLAYNPTGSAVYLANGTTFYSWGSSLSLLHTGANLVIGLGTPEILHTAANTGWTLYE